jgi:hypothetical protein
MTVRGDEMTVTRTRTGTAARRQEEFTVQQIASYLNENLGSKLTAFMVGKDVQTVGRWAKGTQSPPQDDVERKLRAAFQAFALISEEDSRHVVRAWFVGMNPQLDDRSPAEAIAEGDLRAVMAAARAFAAGG